MGERRIKLLRDILDAADAIQDFVDEKSLEEYSQSLLLRSAVERQFEIVGEALKRLVSVDAGLAAQIADVQPIIAFRNLIAHGYDVVDAKIVWGVIVDDLPKLVTSVRALHDGLT